MSNCLGEKGKGKMGEGVDNLYKLCNEAHEHEANHSLLIFRREVLQLPLYDYLNMTFW